MTFFYDLNKRLADLAKKQDAEQVAEQAKATAPKSQLAESLDVAEAGYSAKAARAGKDLGKPGKNFSKIAKTAGKAYGSKAAGERVAGAVLNKLRTKEDVAQEGNAFSGAVAKAKANGVQPGEKISVGGKTYPVKETEMSAKQKSFAKLAPPKDKITFADKIAGAKQEVDEMLGDVAAEAMKKAIAGQIGNATEVDEGFKEMDAWLAQREKEKGTGRYDKRKVSTGTVYTRKPETFDEPEGEVSSEPKRRGRPKGKDKGPERVTAKSYKYKDGRPAKKVKEGDAHVCEYCGHALEGEEEIVEKAVSKKQQKFMGMVHAAQKGEKPASKEVAKVAKDMPKKAAKDFAATKHKGLPEKAKAKKEESKEEVEETTTSGSVATASASPKAGKGGMAFGKGVYETYNNTVEGMISEGMSVNISIDEQGKKSISVNATEQDAEMLADLLKMAGLNSERHESCPSCGSADCSCDETLDENNPDWPTNTETLDADPELRTYSGGLNGPKSTGQTTTPVIASQLRRQVSMEENVELERSLFKLYKDISGK